MILKLYNAQLSPYAARCRMQIYAKNLDVELLEMPGTIPPEEFAKLTPMHKVPALDADGKIIPESQIICEYLEGKFPEPPLLPVALEARVEMSLLCRLADLYVMTPMGHLFGQINPQARDECVCDQFCGDLEKGLGWLDAYLDGSAYAVGDTLTLADCALVPVLFFAERISPMFGYEDILARAPNIKAYYQAMQKDPIAARVIGELDSALNQMQGR